MCVCASVSGGFWGYSPASGADLPEGGLSGSNVIAEISFKIIKAIKLVLIDLNILAPKLKF